MQARLGTPAIPPKRTNTSLSAQKKHGSSYCGWTGRPESKNKAVVSQKEVKRGSLEEKHRVKFLHRASRRSTEWGHGGQCDTARYGALPVTQHLILSIFIIERLKVEVGMFLIAVIKIQRLIAEGAV